MATITEWLTSEHVLRLIYLLGLSLTALFSGVAAYLSNKSNKGVNEVNDAVNHRHLKTDENGNTPPKLFDLVWENHQRSNELIEWKRTYDGGPLSTGPKVDNFVDKTTDKLEELTVQLDEIDEKGQQRHDKAMDRIRNVEQHVVDLRCTIHPTCDKHDPDLPPEERCDTCPSNILDGANNKNVTKSEGSENPGGRS